MVTRKNTKYVQERLAAKTLGTAATNATPYLRLAGKLTHFPATCLMLGTVKMLKECCPIIITSTVKVKIADLYLD